MCAILNVENLMNFESLTYALLFRFCLQPHLQLLSFFLIIWGVGWRLTPTSRHFVTVYIE